MKAWDQFSRRVIIKKPVADIYKMWATPQGLTTWFLRVATYTDAKGNEREPTAIYQKGDTYRWEWHNWDGFSEGKVLDHNGENFIQFEFESSIVDVTIEPFIDGRTLVSLLQSEIPDDDATRLRVYCGCSSGWTFWLTNLKAYLEHGVLLNERGKNMQNHFDGYELVNT